MQSSSKLEHSTQPHNSRGPMLMYEEFLHPLLPMLYQLASMCTKLLRVRVFAATFRRWGLKKPHWQSCWLLGYPSAVQKEWTNVVLGNLKNFGMKIKSHGKHQAHLDASITFGRRNALMASKNRQSRQERPSGGRVCFGS